MSKSDDVYVFSTLTSSVEYRNYGEGGAVFEAEVLRPGHPGRKALENPGGIRRHGVAPQLECWREISPDEGVGIGCQAELTVRSDGQ